MARNERKQRLRNHVAYSHRHTSYNIYESLDIFRMNPETLTRQSLTNFDYLALIGIANWVFNSNVEFLIENIDKEHHGRSNISWFVLIEETADQLVQKHEKLIRLIIGDTGFELFRTLIAKRNAIVHAIPTGEKDDGYPIAIYREKTHATVCQSPKPTFWIL